MWHYKVVRFQLVWLNERIENNLINLQRLEGWEVVTSTCTSEQIIYTLKRKV